MLVKYVSIKGFDTHVSKMRQKNRLLKKYADGVGFLIKFLKKYRFNNVLIITFSKFSESLGQKARKRTEYGTAKYLLLLGEGLNQNSRIDEFRLNEVCIKMH